MNNRRTRATSRGGFHATYNTRIQMPNNVGKYHRTVAQHNISLFSQLTEQGFMLRTRQTSYCENKLHNTGDKCCSCVVHTHIIFKWRCFGILREIREFDVNAEYQHQWHVTKTQIMKQIKHFAYPLDTMESKSKAYKYTFMHTLIPT